MLDQSFSSDNFRIIFDIENRKGNYLEGEFFPEAKQLSGRIKECNNEIRSLRGLDISKEEYRQRRQEIEERKNTLINEKDRVLFEIIDRISTSLSDPQFKIEIIKDKNHKGKPIYSIKRTPQNVFILKQLQYNLRKLYKVKQANRYVITKHLKILLGDGFPKVVIRADIKSFYESVLQEQLMDKLNNENLLTHTSRKYIGQIFRSYNASTQTQIGVPRGIGISAYLIELYMREIDSRIKQLDGVTYYSRYVDDMIIILNPSIALAPSDIFERIKNIVEDSKHGLKLNLLKSKYFSVSKETLGIADFEYLGFSFSLGYSSYKTFEFAVRLSKKKQIRIRKRIKETFKAYEVQKKRSPKSAFRLCVLRIKYLTSNTRLLNNKKYVLTGAHFNNQVLTSSQCFQEIDEYFKEEVNRLNASSALKSRLLTFSFVRAFESPMEFAEFSPAQFNSIMAAWR